MASIKVAIIIPAFNEEDSIGQVIEELIDVTGRGLVPLVVDDYSTDGTGIEAIRAGAEVLSLNKNHGYAQAINKGFEYICSKYNVDYLLTMDADGQHDPESVKKIIDLLSESSEVYDLIVGRRRVNARISEYIFSLYYRGRFKIKDPLCGLKVYSTKVYEKYSRFETFDSIGTELLTWALLKNMNVKEVFVNIRPRKGLSRFGGGIRVNLRILLALLRLMYFIYRMK